MGTSMDGASPSVEPSDSGARSARGILPPGARELAHHNVLRSFGLLALFLALAVMTAPGSDIAIRAMNEAPGVPPSITPVQLLVFRWSLFLFSSAFALAAMNVFAASLSDLFLVWRGANDAA